MNLTHFNMRVFYRRLFTIVMVVILLATIFIGAAQVQGTSIVLAASPASVQESGVAQDATTETKIYLPAVYHSYPYQTIFGIESSSMASSKLAATAKAGAYFVRLAAFSWAQIEPVRTTPATYHWETVNETALRQVGLSGLRAVASVKYTPPWAQQIAGVTCGPVAQVYLDEFAEFMGNLVARYSLPPYSIKYWEIGNEVDVDPSLVPPDSIYGCWGNKNDKYYGGGYYAQMLQYVYPAIKAVDPQAQVLIGGLLVNCDPTNAGSNDCKSSKFLEGILVGGGAPYFDVVSFHAFAFYQGGQINENLPTWGPRGGVVLGKINFLREVMANYGVNKPLMLTEASLLCPEGQPGCDPVSDAFLNAQADYVGMLYTRTWNANLLGTIWFTLEGPGWRQSGLYSAVSPRPSYYAYQFLSNELRGVSLVGSLDSQYAGITGYEFQGLNKKIWVLWPPDRTDHTITLPASTTQVYDKFGIPIVPAGNQITFNGVVVIELAP